MQLDVEEKDTTIVGSHSNLRKAQKNKSLKRRNQALIGSNFAELKRQNQQNENEETGVDENDDVEGEVTVSHGDHWYSKQFLGTTDKRALSVNALAAKTALVMTYSWSPPSISSDIVSYTKQLLERKVIDPVTNLVGPLWIENTHIPHSADDLDPHFRGTFGITTEKALEVKKEKKRAPDGSFVDISEFSASKSNTSTIGMLNKKSEIQKTDYKIKSQNPESFVREGDEVIELGQRKKQLKFLPKNQILRDPFISEFKREVDENECAKRLSLSKEAISYIFPYPALVVGSGKEEEDFALSFPFIVENVELTILPIGTAVMSIQMNWVTKETAVDGLTIEDIRTRIFLAKFRQKVNAKFGGWILNTKAIDDDNLVETFKRMNQYYGYSILKSIYLNQPTSLTQISNYLIAIGDENLNSPVTRFQKHLKRSYHHSLIVTDKEIEENALYDYLLHMSKGDGQQPHGSQMKTKDESHYYLRDGEKSYGIKIHRLRNHRYIASSRQGSISISWAEKGIKDPEVTLWPLPYFGVFLMLATYVNGEVSILNEFSNQQMITSYQLKRTMIICADNVINTSQLNELEQTRKNLFGISILITRYGLQMGSDNCGGLSDYVEFFTALRRV